MRNTVPLGLFVGVILILPALGISLVNPCVENVLRVSAASVFLMFFAMVLFFREPSKSSEVRTESVAVTLRNFSKVVTNPKFVLFLLIFSRYRIVYWQEFITLPIYVHDYVDPKADTERMLSIGPIIVIAFTVLFSVLTQKISAFRAVILGTLISMVAFSILAVHSNTRTCDTTAPTK